MMHTNQRQPKPLVKDFDYFSKVFLAREDYLILISQLNQLVKAVQRHRGISMGMLAGNTDFQMEFEDLQRQLERRLATLEAFARANQVLSDRDKENLSLAWQTIRSNWQDDNLNDNFELHSHFIEQLLSMVANLAKRLKEPLTAPLSGRSERKLVSIGDGAFSHSRLVLQADILTFVGKDLPTLIEQVARIRGTAAYGAAIASLDGLDERKIRFWVNSLRELSEQIRTQAEALSAIDQPGLNSLAHIKQNEIQLLQFLNTVESVVLAGKGGREEAHRIFNMATDVIEVYWGVIGEGLTLVQRWHREDLEAWIKLT